MIDNLKLFELSINNKEPYIDKYYAKNNTPIITADSKKFNDLMRANIEILENISAYKIASESKNKAMQNTILKNIVSRLNVSGINFSEFTSFWATKDVSYSIYKGTLKTDDLKIEFLKNIIPEYLKDRHALYKNHGYSATTLQTVNDSKAHKENGNSGSVKIADIFSVAGFEYFDSKDLDLFVKSKKIFIYPDKTNKTLFKEILKRYNIKFEWSKNHENKQTDFLFKVDKNIFIMEHKHMKEAGGGQDKQMSEIINFISYKDKNVHYISFLDGVYFNLLADKEIKSGKSFEQRLGIITNLKKNKQNYFVNTFGFSKLVRSARS
jgi:hypothetical protein